MNFRLIKNNADREGAYRVRRSVFVEEQGVPESLEMDSLDATAIHLVAVCPAGIVGTARLYPEPESEGIWHVGRVAVLLVWRGRGVGEGLMDLAAATARERGARELTLNAQVSVISFYERLGYTAEGETFLDAGIEHRKMRRSLG